MWEVVAISNKHYHQIMNGVAPADIKKAANAAS
jgi:hypothetical protein